MSHKIDIIPADSSYHQLLMSMTDGFVMHEIIRDGSGSPVDYRFLEVNPAFLSITGLSHDNLIGKTLREIFPETSSTLIQHFRLANPAGEPYVFVRHVNETGRYLQISAYLLATGLLACVLVDITERIRSEETLIGREAQYRELAELANVIILRWKASGVITYINEFGEKCFGFNKNELIGRNVIGTIVESIETGGQGPSTMIREISLNPDAFKNNENENITKDGRRLWMQWNNSAVFDSDGNIIEIISIARDNTEQKRIEDALRESEATFRTHIENSFDVIFTLDAEGTFLFVSPSWERHFGYPASEVIGKPFGPYVHPDDVEPCLEYLIRVLSTGQSGTSPRYRVKRTDGSWLSFVANGTRYIDKNGQMSFIGVGHDITEQLKAEEERLDYERRLLHSQKLESLGVLAGGIAHDFNNLLQAIHGNLELSTKKLPPDSISKRYIEQAIHATRHAADLTSRMLAYSGKGNFIVKELDLNDLVNENASMLRTAVSKAITMELHTGTKLPAIMADIAQLQQVVMNLITNAAEAIEAQPGFIRLSTGVQDYDKDFLAGSRLFDKPQPGRFVYLEITDNGIGMDRETQERIFDPFFSTKFTGRGLGMSAVQGIIKGHGGALFIESTPGNGTTIKVIFPAVEASVTDTVQNTDADPENTEEVALSGMALVVDDEKSVLKIAVTMVKLCGLKVITACNGTEAVSKFREQYDDIDVVLMDLTMPSMDGVTAMRELKLIKPSVKIILCSGFNEQELSDRVNEQAPAGFLRKPYSMKELGTELQRVMAGTAGEKQLKHRGTEYTEK